MPPMSDHDTWNTFAAAALQGMLASPFLADHIKNVGKPSTTMDEYSFLAIAARAYADALLAESKKRETPAEPTPPQPDDDGWIKWEGGECPVDGGVVVNIRMRDGETGSGDGPDWWWGRTGDGDPGEIIAYRIVSEAGVTK